jgi:hypothetical protein
VIDMRYENPLYMAEDAGASPRSGPGAGQLRLPSGHFAYLCGSGAVGLVYDQQTKNLLVSYSPKKLGFF